MVSVASAACPLVTVRSDPEGEYVNEHTGEIATSGEMEAQDSVIPQVFVVVHGPVVGVRYPLLGFTLTMPSAPLPAGTLVGATALCKVIVNCGVTASTVKSSGGLVYDVVGPVPVIVIE